MLLPEIMVINENFSVRYKMLPCELLAETILATVVTLRYPLELDFKTILLKESYTYICYRT